VGDKDEGDTKFKPMDVVANVAPPTPSPTIPVPTFETDDHGMPVNPNSVSYPQLAQIAYGDVGETAVRTGITLMQLGICLTYFIFVPHNLSKSIETLLAVKVPLWIGLVSMVLVEIPLSCGRDIRRLHPTNVLANGLILFGLLSCLWLALFATTSSANNEENAIDSSSILEKMSSLSPWNDRWYLFVGTSVSGMEWIVLL
jgi:proton-coupled amino acid transporter